MSCCLVPTVMPRNNVKSSFSLIVINTFYWGTTSPASTCAGDCLPISPRKTFDKDFVSRAIDCTGAGSNNNAM